MSWSKESQERWRSGATVASLLAVPLILTVGGWQIQRQIAQEGIKQQYVQLALSILRGPPAKEDSDTKQLRRWAIQLVDKYAPVKLTPEGAQALFAEGLPAYAFDRAWGTFDTQRSTFASLMHGNCAEIYTITEDKEQYERCLENRRRLNELLKQRAEESEKQTEPRTPK